MLLYPAIDELKTKVDSRYTLSIMAAKRARDLIDGKPQLTMEEGKPLSIATIEIDGDLISYKRREAQAAEAATEEAEGEAEAAEETAEAEAETEAENA
jgi:DNA-directed RNA polymerase subunit omega